jgi:hypothetical protein
MPRRRRRPDHRLRRDFSRELQRRGFCFALQPDAPEPARDRFKLFAALWRAGKKPDWRDFVLSPVLADLEDAIRLHGDWRAHPLLRGAEAADTAGQRDGDAPSPPATNPTSEAP